MSELYAYTRSMSLSTSEKVTCSITSEGAVVRAYTARSFTGFVLWFTWENKICGFDPVTCTLAQFSQGADAPTLHWRNDVTNAEGVCVTEQWLSADYLRNPQLTFDDLYDRLYEIYKTLGSCHQRDK